MIRAGLSLVRINMSHGSHEDHRRNIGLAREAAARVGRPVAVLCDLAGPKIRVGDLEKPVEFRRGAEVVFAPAEVASGAELPTNYPPLARDVTPGDVVLLDA